MSPLHRLGWAVFSLSLILCVEAHALDPAVPLTQYVQRSWDVEDGLPQDAVQAIAQTRDGYLWLGTQEGLVRFDGVRFEVFNSSNVAAFRGNNVLSLYRDRANTLWIGTNGGLLSYRDDRFALIHERSELTVFAIVGGEGSDIWFGSGTAGLFRYAQGRVVHQTGAPGAIYALAMHRGTLWIGARDGLYRRAGSTTTKIEGVEGKIYTVVSTSGGEIWFAGSWGPRRYSGSRVERPIEQLINEETWRLFIDRHGTLWVGTRNGLWRWTNGRLSRIGAKDGLSHDFVESIFEDAEGTLWAGTHLAGVNQLLEGSFQSYARREGLSSDVTWTVAEGDDGSIWAGTERGGVNRFYQGTWTHVAASTPLRDAFVTSVAPETAERAWIGTYGGGLYRLEGGKPVRVYTQADGLPSDCIMGLLRARDGSLWISTLEGLVHLKDGRLRVYGLEDGLPSKFMSNMFEDRQGRLWVAPHSGGGPRVFDGERFTDRSDGRQLPRAVTITISQDRRGEIWFGTRTGVHRFDGTGTFRYTAEQGMPDGAVSQLFEDDRGFFWIATAKGVARVAREELDTVFRQGTSTVHPVVYGVSDGMPSVECSFGVSPSGWYASDGRIWLSTARGLAVLDPRRQAPVLRTPPLVERVRVNATTVALEGPVVMKTDRDRIEFRYTAPTTVVAKHVRFRYRLDGYDHGWINAGESRVAEYTSLPPGHYKFRVEAADGHERRWLAASVVDVRRLPAIYQTHWFRAVAAALLLSLAWFAHHRRLHQVRMRLEAVQDERKRISLEMHDTLAQGLTGAMLHVQSALDAADDREATSEHLQNVKGLLMTTLAEVRNGLQNVRSERLEADDLAQALTDVLHTMTQGLHIRGEVEVVGKRRRLSDPVIEHHLLRIGQEAITNALRHSNARNVLLRIDFQPKKVSLMVRDDGKGSGEFNVEQVGSSSYGLRGMRERAERIGAKLTANSRRSGFEIIVEVRA
ncbi:MAG TPA: two-component regulator propeller domain-containing protein [Thermoanaerobaculia bacterium]|nr:two-component regulator propeller domain-containing protein [Thermoanaerobaculia bacterium]